MLSIGQDTPDKPQFWRAFAIQVSDAIHTRSAVGHLYEGPSADLEGEPQGSGRGPATQEFIAQATVHALMQLLLRNGQG
jgi:hypothetical protein